MSKPNACFVVLAAIAMAAPLAAHHGRGASFDMKKQVTLKGTVSQVKWQNPHVLIFIDVPEQTGKCDRETPRTASDVERALPRTDACNSDQSC